MTKSPRVAIVSEGGSAIGFGHLARCQSLFEAFVEAGVRPTFLIDGDRSAIEFCRNHGGQHLPWHKEPAQLWRSLASVDMVVVDSLQATEYFFHQLQDRVEIPVVLDDFVRRSYRRGIVVDWTILAESRFYPERAPEVTYLLGSAYAALRKAFWDVPTKPVAREIEHILITFGGSDVAGMTPRIMKLLMGHFPAAAVDIVIGPGFGNIAAIEKLQQPCHNLVRCPGAKEMVRLMRRADLAVATGGQTLYELARMGVPTIGVMVVDNQRDDIRGWSDAGFLLFAGDAADSPLDQSVLAWLERVREYEVRLPCAQQGRQHIDGNGARRLIAALGRAL